MKKVGYLITLLSILSAFSFNSQAGQTLKRPPSVFEQGIQWNNSL
jgi:hypothetical protein